MNARILVVEDEPTIATGLRDDLELEGFAVEVVDDGTVALGRILEEKFDLILLDLMLPGMDGLDVCREARLKGNRTPVIMLTAKGQEVDKVVGLELGADDYITKPFSRREVSPASRRCSTFSRRPEPGGIFVCRRHRRHRPVRVSRRGERIDLTATEFKLLQVFLENRGQVLTIDDLLHKAWGRDAILTDRVVYTHVNNLRHKLEENPQKPRFLVGVRGIGYRFDG